VNSLSLATAPGNGQCFRVEEFGRRKRFEFGAISGCHKKRKAFWFHRYGNSIRYFLRIDAELFANCSRRIFLHFIVSWHGALLTGRRNFPPIPQRLGKKLIELQFLP
jgi:hypothetical protein